MNELFVILLVLLAASVSFLIGYVVGRESNR